jgi:uncharacterized protein (DUF58 family)
MRIPLLGAVKSQWQRWWLNRHPARDEQLLTQRNIYIVPTKVGAAFLLTQALLLVASINDQLNLGYALTFLLCGAGLASMHTTHGNLRGLTLSLLPPPASHAGDDQSFVVRLHNPGRLRFGLGLRVADATSASLAWVDLPAQGHAEARLSWRAPGRGLHALPVLRIETRFPLGLFVAWSYWRPASPQWVYPAVEATPPPLPAGRAPEGEALVQPSLAHGSGDEFHGVRGWRDGDSLRSVLWKKAAQNTDPSAPLWVRELGAPPQGSECWLDAADTRGLPAEQRWQRLTAWVLAADRAGPDWGLRLPGQPGLPLGQGPQHRRQALEQLAVVQG